jgi:hypothetical protein
MHTQQLPLDLGELPASPPHLWDWLPAEHQSAVVGALARLIAQAAIREEDDFDATDHSCIYGSPLNPPRAPG